MRNPYENTQFVGGHGGGSFKDMSDNGGHLTRIETWKSSYDGHPMIKSIRVTFSDGSSFTQGNNSGLDNKKEAYFDDTELITELSLWGNGNGKRLGRIWLRTNTGQIYDSGHTDGSTEYHARVGSGICVGIEGRAGSDVDELGFIFVKQVKQSYITDLEYPTLASDAHCIQPETIRTFSAQNTHKDNDNDWNFKGSRSETKTSMWKVSRSAKIYGETSIKGKIPKIGEVGQTFGWEFTIGDVRGTSTSETVTLSWDNSGTLEPGESIYLEAVTRKGNLANIPYTGNHIIETIEGDILSFPIEGTYNEVDYTGVEVVTSCPPSEP